MEFVNTVMDNWESILFALTSIISGATVITAMTPSKADDAAVNFVLKFLNLLAGNVGKNVNKDA